MRRKIVAGNWKMNGDLSFVGEYTGEFKNSAEELLKQTDGLEIVLAPPSILLGELKSALGNSVIAVSGQNISQHEGGAYTGETSVGMLKSVGASWCLVGHSERRSLFGETDELVLEKTRALLSAGLTPVVCVGETLEQREQGFAVDIVSAQVLAVFDALDESELENVVVAYEPVWAIGTGKTASPAQAQEMHAEIRKVVARKSEAVAEKLVILYGGSVNSATSAELFEQKDIDGGLVGGASLKPQEFLKICQSMA